MFDKTMIPNDTQEMYDFMNYQLPFLLEDVNDNIANYSNTSALINFYLKDINWVGFYLVKGDHLILGPFQGIPACTKITIDQGVCGTAASSLKTQIVNNVDEFPGHIACDSASKSEIVIPIIINEKLIGVLDIDSPSLNRFDKIDAMNLEIVINQLINYISID